MTLRLRSPSPPRLTNLPPRRRPRLSLLPLKWADFRAYTAPGPVESPPLYMTHLYGMTLVSRVQPRAARAWKNCAIGTVVHSTHDKRGDDTNTQDTQELTTAKQTPALTEQVLEKETHELRFGNGLGVTARGSGHGMNGVTCKGG